MSTRTFSLQVFIGLALVLTFAAPVPATQLKAKGAWEFTTQHVKRHFLRDGVGGQDPLSTYQRLLLQVDATASPDLSGTVVFHLDSLWGNTGNPWTPDGATGGALGTDGKGVAVAQAFLNWRVPETELRFRIGRQLFVNPCLVAGSAVLVDRANGISWTWGLDESFALGGYWLVARNDNYTQLAPSSGSQLTRPSDASGAVDDAHFFNLHLAVRGDGFQVIPWGMYGRIGRNSGEMTREMMMPQVWTATETDNDYADSLFAGITGEVTLLDPFRFAFDFNYGSNRGIESSLNRTGWFMAASAEYKMEHMTPKIVAWYGSGDDGDISNGSERMPSLSASWWVSSFGHSGYWMNGASHGYNADSIHLSPVGTAGLSFMLDNIQFFDRLRHVIRLNFEWGTNDPAMAGYIRAVDRVPGDYANLAMRQDYAVYYPYDSLLYLTTKDRLVEFNFDTAYQIYDNLKFVFEVGLIRLHLDEDVWRTQSGYDKLNHRVAANLIYTF